MVANKHELIANAAMAQLHKRCDPEGVRGGVVIV